MGQAQKDLVLVLLRQCALNTPPSEKQIVQSRNLSKYYKKKFFAGLKALREKKTIFDEKMQPTEVYHKEVL